MTPPSKPVIPVFAKAMAVVALIEMLGVLILVFGWFNMDVCRVQP